MAGRGRPTAGRGHVVRSADPAPGSGAEAGRARPARYSLRGGVMAAPGQWDEIEHGWPGRRRRSTRLDTRSARCWCFCSSVCLSPLAARVQGGPWSLSSTFSDAITITWPCLLACLSSPRRRTHPSPATTLHRFHDIHLDLLDTPQPGHAPKPLSHQRFHTVRLPRGSHRVYIPRVVGPNNPRPASNCSSRAQLRRAGKQADHLSQSLTPTTPSTSRQIRAAAALVAEQDTNGSAPGALDACGSTSPPLQHLTRAHTHTCPPFTKPSHPAVSSRLLVLALFFVHSLLKSQHTYIRRKHAPKAIDRATRIIASASRSPRSPPLERRAALPPTGTVGTDPLRTPARRRRCSPKSP